MMETKTFKAPNISCMHCVHTIQTELGELGGVTSVKAEADSKLVTVNWEAPATWEKIKTLMAEIGYPVEA
jgi:copper chaperone CopZ